MFLSKGKRRASSVGKCVLDTRCGVAPRVCCEGRTWESIFYSWKRLKIEPVGTTIVRHLRRGNRDIIKALSICGKVNVIKIQS